MGYEWSDNRGDMPPPKRSRKKPTAKKSNAKKPAGRRYANTTSRKQKR